MEHKTINMGCALIGRVAARKCEADWIARGKTPRGNRFVESLADDASGEAKLAYARLSDAEQARVALALSELCARADQRKQGEKLPPFQRKESPLTSLFRAAFAACDREGRKMSRGKELPLAWHRSLATHAEGLEAFVTLALNEQAFTEKAEAMQSKIDGSTLHGKRKIALSKALGLCKQYWQALFASAIRGSAQFVTFDVERKGKTVRRDNIERELGRLLAFFPPTQEGRKISGKCGLRPQPCDDLELKPGSDWKPAKSLVFDGPPKPIPADCWKSEICPQVEGKRSKNSEKVGVKPEHLVQLEHWLRYIETSL